MNNYISKYIFTRIYIFANVLTDLCMYVSDPYGAIPFLTLDGGLVL